MFLNIITPCSRPENLHKISQSINIPKENYRWIIVFDMDQLPNEDLIPNSCEVYLYKESGSIVGHAQRSFALNLIKDGHIYFNDDDTVLHQNLWENIKNIDNDFISFKQTDKSGRLRLVGDNIEVGGIDSHNFLVSKELYGDSRVKKDLYYADGVFAEECYKKSKTPIHLPIVLSVYNSLR